MCLMQNSLGPFEFESGFLRTITTDAVDPYITGKRMSSSQEPELVEVDTALTFLAHRSASLGDLLRTNSPPSEREAGLRETELMEAYGVREKLDQEIEEVEIALSLLKSKKKDIRTIIRKYRRVLSPVRRLAPEILMEIFRWTIPNEQGFSITDTKSGPWALSHVSSLWRAVTLGCPELWSCFYVQIVAQKDCFWSRRQIILNTVLSRSGTRGLNFSYSYYTPYYNSDAYGLLDALSAHSGRWIAVSLILSDDMFAELRDIRGALESLQSLKIEMQEVHERTLETIDAFEFAPRLTHVKLIGRLDDVNFVFPWHQLISFCEEPSEIFASEEFPSFFLGVLQKCECLQEFTIPTFEGIPDFDPNDLTHVVHISLTHLIVKNRSLLPCLTFPSLHALSLDQNDYTGPEAISDVCDLIGRSGCSLTELCFDGFSPKPVIQLLEQCPNLRQLSFSYRPGEWRRDVDNEFMELVGSRINGFSGFLGGPDVVPRLQSLSITIDNKTALKIRCINDDFVEKMKARWRPGYNSQSLGLLRSFELSATVDMVFPELWNGLRKLKQLKEEGMAISIATKNVGDIKASRIYV
ncbi:hypothetical protein EDD18DRAFT_1138898 [Armillaria luteobubalina]|uniref:F-box domain-containing protein n=1 Tax=Armillaria luteobubalina TaxID=153913 RepID=A0AA39QFL5_9AGAR|nr:hypothetical protein EDD18DRAFT_1138898 [Armillaria luteobubalina]